MANSNDDSIQKLGDLLNQEKVKAYPEIQLNGYPWEDFSHVAADQIRGVRLVCEDEAIVEFLKRREIITNGNPVIQEQADGSTLHQVKLNPRLLSAFAEGTLKLTSSDPINDNPLFPLKNIGEGIRVSLESCNSEKETGLSDMLILRSRDSENISTLIKILTSNGLLPAGKGRKAGFSFLPTEQQDGIVAAVAIPSELAEAIERTAKNNITYLTDHVKDPAILEKLESSEYDFQEVLRLAAQHLPPQPKTQVMPVPKKHSATEGSEVETEAQPLESFKQSLAEHTTAFQRERRLDNTYHYYVYLDGQSKSLIDSLSSFDECSAPVTFSYKSRNRAGEQYQVSQADFERLTALLPGKPFESELPAIIPENALGIKHDHQHATETRWSVGTKIRTLLFQPDEKGNVYLTVVADTKQRLTRFCNALPAKNDLLGIQFATEDNEFPAIARLLLSKPVAADIKAQNFSIGVRKQTEFLHESTPVPSSLKKWAREAKKRFEVSLREKAAADEKSSDEDIEKPNNGKKSEISPEERTQLEEELIARLSKAIQKQEEKDDFLPAAFAYVERTKTEKLASSTPQKLERRTVSIVEPSIFLRVGDATYRSCELDSALLRKQFGIIDTQEGSGSLAYHTLCITGLSTEGFASAIETLSNVPHLNASGETHSNQGFASEDELKLHREGGKHYNECLKKSTAYNAVSHHFQALKKQAEQDKKLFEMGLKDDPALVKKYEAYQLWSKDKAAHEKPSDEDIALIEGILNTYKREKAIKSAYSEITSKDLLLASVDHLSRDELSEIEPKLAKISAMQEAISANLKLISSLTDQLQGLNKNTAIGQIAPSISASLEEAVSSAEQAASHIEALQKQVDELNEQTENYKLWLEMIQNTSGVKQVLLLRATSQTQRMLKALDIQNDASDPNAHMTRDPILLEGVLSNGRDVLMLYPTAHMMQDIIAKLRERAVQDAHNAGKDEAKALQSFESAPIPLLTDGNIRPDEIMPLLRKRYVSEETKEAAPVRQKTDFPAIMRQLGTSIKHSGPMLFLERQEPTHPNNRTTRELGTQKVLAFTVREKRDLRHIQNIYETLQRSGGLAPYQYYGNDLVDGTPFLSEAEQTILTLQETEQKIKPLAEYFSSLANYYSRLSSEDAADRTFAKQGLTEFKEQLGTRAHEAELLIKTISEQCDDDSVLPLLEHIPNQLVEADHSNKTATDAQLATLSELSKNIATQLRSAIRNKLAEYDIDTIENLKDASRRLMVPVESADYSITDATGNKVEKLQDFHASQPRGEAYMLKLYVKPEVWDATVEYIVKQNGGFRSSNAAQAEAFLPGKIHENWTQALGRSGRGIG